MAADDETLMLAWASASPEMVAPLAAALPDPRYGVAEVAADVEAGALALLGVYAAGRGHVGTVAVRFTVCHGHREMVIVAASGACQGVNLVSAVMPGLLKLARDAGYESVRLHSIRAGMERALAPHGFKAVETVYRAAVH